MKKLILSLILSGVAVVPAFGQGTLSFGNFDGGSADLPFFEIGGLTRLGAGAAPASAFSVQLYYGAVGSPAAALVNTGTPVSLFSTAGYFFGPSVALSGFASGSTAAVQFRAWDNRTGSTWESATVRGESAVLNSPVLVAPPTIPSFVTASGQVNLVAVPEPATLALGIFGAAGLLFRRRK